MELRAEALVRSFSRARMHKIRHLRNLQHSEARGTVFVCITRIEHYEWETRLVRIFDGPDLE
jgi:hypothetical protein